MLFRKKPHEQTRSSKDMLSDAVHRTMAVVWFAPDGTILGANDNFCAVMGYDATELAGAHHRLFVDDATAQTPGYARFWDRLRAGEAFSDRYLRLGKGGREIWIQASYVPVTSAPGTVEKIVKFATDISAQVQEAARQDSRLAALDRSQAVVEFALDGTIKTANANFLAATGYTLPEIEGKHHAIFMPSGDRESARYRAFWDALGRGEPQQGAYRRLRKSGEEIWLQATYNPVLDAAGRPVAVVKVAHDITRVKQRAIDHQGQIDALNRSQAVISFHPDGTVIDANDGFLEASGYGREEVVGQHHSMFIDPSEASDPAYGAFWERLGAGAFQSGEFCRRGKDGREFWIQATYNPILDDGRVIKVVKFATDITARRQALAALEHAVGQLAQNDLSSRIDVDVPPDFEALKSGFNSSVSALSQVVSGIMDRAGLILSEVAQIAGAAQDLSARTERQAAALEETAASLDQMGSTIESAAESAREASESADAADDSAALGLKKAERAAKAMADIAQSSDQVRKITSVIDDIAFQTNLLALNAGVEAARAGESGRGFAVVAAEVRQLAQRSSESSQEIAELINATTSQVQGGVGLVEDSRSALVQIAHAVEDIRARVTGLAQSSREQSQGLKEITIAANQIDQTTQQNVAMFEETTAATQTLKALAEELAASTRKFTFRKDTMPADGWDADSRETVDWASPLPENATMRA